MYDTKNSPYHRVESLFDDQNYWVNVETTQKKLSSELTYDLNDNNVWEFVMEIPPEVKIPDKKDLEDDEQALMSEEDFIKKNKAESETQQYLSLPPTWVPPINIQLRDVKGGFCMNEKIAEHYDGTVKRWKEYDETVHGKVLEIEKFIEGADSEENTDNSEEKQK
eukprot:UN29381